MNLAKILGHRLHKWDILELCRSCSGIDNNAVKEDLFAMIGHDNDVISYNALWVFSHFAKPDIKWLTSRRNELIDQLLLTGHVGKRRLILTLLEHLPIAKEDVRTDYIDFCLSKINSNEPVAIRSLCLKQSFALCRFYPELMVELTNEIELMGCGELSSGLLSVRKNIMMKISH